MTITMERESPSREMYSSWWFKLFSSLGCIIHLILIDYPKDVYRWITMKRKSVEGQVIVITGGGSGLGRRMAEILAIEEKAIVAILDINKENADQTVSNILTAGGKASAWLCDISDASQMKKVAEEIENLFGKVDIVVCNAAILAFRFFMELSEKELKSAFDINVIGTVNTIRAFLGSMEQRNEGQIVSVASIAGFYGETYGLGYCPTKFAVRGVMECLQMELRDMGLEGIVCTTLCPYFARTPMVLNAGLRPTCTWFPFMSIDTCSRKMVDSILKEKVVAFVPNYIALTTLFKNLVPQNVARTLRDYMSIKYDPSHGASQRKLLPVVNDYFVSPSIAWYFVVTVGMTLNVLALFSPQTLDSPFLPFIGPPASKISLEYPFIPILTNIFAVVCHLFEAIYALVLCDRARFSLACSFKWFVQTFILGYPSLRLLRRFVNKDDQ